MRKLAAIILAAGKSTRMKSRISKVLHPLAGRSLISYPIEAARTIGARPLFVVTGPDHGELKLAVKGMGAQIVYQKEALGTAHAVLQAKRVLSKFSGHVLILCGDAPLIRAETLKTFIEEMAQEDATCAVLTMELKDPASYGRIIRDLDGRLARIVEACDANGNELSVREVNTGIFCVEKKWLMTTLKRIKPKNRKQEYYLTDIVHYAICEGKKIIAVKARDANEFLGVNTRSDLAEVAAIMRERINMRHMLSGVGILNPRESYIDADVIIGADTTIWPNTFILGKTVVGGGCTIENGVVLKDAKVADKVHLKSYSVIEGSAIDEKAVVGPFSRIRPESLIGPNARVGNFVEIKKTELNEGAKANHLTYLGDAYIGARVNVGCGTITCNYDGAKKHRTIIEEGAFIGSDTQFVAPVKIGKGATIGAGSTITLDVPPKALALTRTPQVIVKNWKPKRRAKGRD